MSLALPRCARAAPAGDEHALSVVMADGPYFTTDRWLPIRVILANRSTTDMAGEVVFPFAGKSEKVTFRLPLVVPARSGLTTTAYIYFPTPPDAPARKKGTEVPALCIAEWRSNDGAMKARCPLLGQLVPDDTDTTPGKVNLSRTFLMAISGQPDPSANTFPPPTPPLPETAVDADTFLSMCQTPQGTRLLYVSMDSPEAPRDLLAYDAAAAVVLDGSAVDRLDPAQRQALIDYMTTGGNVVLADPLGAIDGLSTWLAPYLPARRIGQHFAGSFSVRTGDKTDSYKLITPLDLCEWLADPTIPDATIVASDANYAQTAYRRVGLGRLIVTSFPISGLDPKSPAALKLWSDLFPTSTGVAWQDSKLAASEGQMLESMVGLKVPPWIIAASVVGIYVAIVLAIQLIARQGRRPIGFAAAVGASIAIAAGLLIFSLFRDRTVNLSVARIDVLDLGRGGIRNEAATLLGPETQSFPLTVSVGATLRQAASAESGPLDLSIAPLRSDRAGIFPRRIERVWQATAAVPAEQSLTATGLFDEHGFLVKVDNHVGPISGALLLSSNRFYSLPAIAQGENSVRADDADLAPPGPPINHSTVQLAAEQLRGSILGAAMTPALPGGRMDSTHAENSITLAGWLNDAPPSLLQLPADAKSPVMRSNALVRTRVEIGPSAVGTKVHVAAPFTQMVLGEISALPYDPAQHTWLDAFMPQDFCVGFAMPPEIGHVKATTVQIDLQATLPTQTMVIHRGQCKNGTPVMDPRGEIVATWSQLIGSTKSVSFEVSPGDVDANGWVWLMFSVQGPFEQSRWSIADLSVSYDGVVDGPPQAMVLPKRDPVVIDAPPAAVSKTPPVKKPTAKPAKKPATKPTTRPKKKEGQPQ